MGETRHSDGPGGVPPPGHELSDLAPRAIAIFLVVLGVMIVGVLAVSVWIQDYSTSRLARTEAPPPSLAKPTPPPGPRLQVSAPKEMQQFQAEEDATLTSYGWVNQAQGVVRIPIDRAMQLLADRGLPAAGSKSEPAKTRPK